MSDDLTKRRCRFECDRLGPGSGLGDFGAVCLAFCAGSAPLRGVRGGALALLWHSNTFFPEKDTLAYNDSLLGYAPLA